MIVYFSGTGNSKYAAIRIAEALGDRAVAAEDCAGEISLAKGEVLGLITPTYWLGLSVMMRHFIRKMQVTMEGDNYVFLTSTYGLLAGFIGKDARKELQKKQISLDAAYCIHMPEIWTPIFSARNTERFKKQNATAEGKIDRIITQIKGREKGDFIRSPFPYFLHGITQALVESERKTKHFHVESSCISCGLCASKCPVKAIELKDGKPVWVKKKCAICLRCLHSCPKFAIQYGRMTKHHGQYQNPKVKL